MALPLETILRGTGDFRETGAGASLRAYGGRWDEGRKTGAGCVLSFRVLCFVENEGEESPVVLEPALGSRGPAGDEE